MKLSPPLSDYISGATPTHASLNGAAKLLKVSPVRVRKRLTEEGLLNSEGRPTTKAVEEGALDTCEGKALWRVKALSAILRGESQKTNNPSSPSSTVGRPADANAKGTSSPRVRTEPAWVDLETVGTYFGAGKVKVGQWLDQLGMRSPKKEEAGSESAFDMLDAANKAKAQQGKGFVSKEPTEKALSLGLARKLTVTNRKQEEIEITQWNLDLCKTLLVKAGHPLDTEHKMALKGKGRNSNVQVNGMEAKAKELYVEWAKLYNDPANRWRIKSLFSGQPTMLLKLVEEEHMKMPGYLTAKKYLSEC